MSTEGCKLSNSVVALQHCWWQMVANATGSNHFSRFSEELARVAVLQSGEPP